MIQLDRDGAAGESSVQGEQEAADAESAVSASEYDPEDVSLFQQTIKQQFEAVVVALGLLRKDPNQKDLIDGLFRTFQTIQNSTGYMGLDEIKEYAGRTVGLVDQGRKTDMDFSLMLDILEQEFAILKEMILKAMEGIVGGPVDDPTEKCCDS